MSARFETNYHASLIIVSYNTREILRACLLSILAARGELRIKIIVVDNASNDQSAQMVAQDFPQIELIRSPYNLGFAAANNLAWPHCQGRYVVLLNPDARLSSDALTRAIEHMNNHPNIALAGGRLLNMQHHDEPAARCFPSLLNEFLVLSGLASRFASSRFFGRFDRSWADPSQDAEVDWVPGAFTIIRREAITSSVLFDERFFLYYEEVDLCRRLKHEGWRIQYWPDIVVHHIGGASSRTVQNQAFSSHGAQLVLWRNQSCLLYYHKHHGALYTQLVYQFHLNWHRFRLFKNRHTPNKAQQAAQSLSNWQHAWQKTRGGTHCPQRPW